MALRNIWFIAFFINFYQSYRLKKARERYKNDIVLFAKECLGASVINPKARSVIDNDEIQHTILTLDESIGRRDAAIIFLWRFICFPNCRTYIISNQPVQLKKLLWREIHCHLSILKATKYKYLAEDILMTPGDIKPKGACSNNWFIRVIAPRREHIMGLGGDCMFWLDNTPKLNNEITDIVLATLGYPGKTNRVVLNRGRLF